MKHHDTKNREKILEGIYHKSQEKAWDGREILTGLVEKYGVPKLPAEKERALCNIFAVIMEGEMAAWKVSLQLAEKVSDVL